MSHGALIIMITSFPAGFQWVSWLPTQIKTGCSDITVKFQKMVLPLNTKTFIMSFQSCQLIDISLDISHGLKNGQTPFQILGLIST